MTVALGAIVAGAALLAGALVGAIHLEHILILAALVLGLIGGFYLAKSRHNGKPAAEPEAVHHILLPFTGTEISRRAVDAALRLARAEGATLMPAYLAEVPKSLPLDCPIPREAAQAMAMLEAIEQRAGRQRRPGRRPDRARPHLPPRPRPPALRRGASTASSSPPAPPAPRASPATTSSGCSSAPRPR